MRASRRKLTAASRRETRRFRLRRPFRSKDFRASYPPGSQQPSCARALAAGRPVLNCNGERAIELIHAQELRGFGSDQAGS